jgi:transcription elongation factor GreA
MSEPTTWLTQAAHDALTAELAEREGPLRKTITAKIEKAREEGDLKENAGYHAAKEEQGHNEARVRQLRHLLDNAQVGVPDAHPDEVSHGRVVTVRFDDGEEERFLLASREEAAHADIEVYSPSGPLGAAILGKQAGDVASYTLPNGSTMTVTVVSVEEYSA